MTIKKRDIELPGGLMMGLTEAEAARAWGLSPNQWANLPREMKPAPRRIGGRKIYIRADLERAIYQTPLWDNGTVDNEAGEEW